MWLLARNQPSESLTACKQLFRLDPVRQHDQHIVRAR